MVRRKTDLNSPTAARGTNATVRTCSSSGVPIEGSSTIAPSQTHITSG